jgi:thiosulfate/3-mercaptopyruvate sulfurtransferase
MKNRMLFLALGIAAAVSTLLPGHSAQACSRTHALVSTAWLAEHMDRPDLVVVDVRSSDAYAAGHIPSAINLPFAAPVSAWITQRNGLLLEVPDQAELFATLGAAGIDKNSFVVVVNNTNAPGVPPSYPRAQTARVAITLLYAGVKDVAILDGGFTNWAAEGRAQSTDIVTPTPGAYNAKVREHMFVSKEYVAASIGNPKSVLLDVRDANVYDGTVIEPFAPRPGHIPTAKSLPASLIWNDDGTFKSTGELWALAASVLGDHRGKEIIIYCGVGGYASGWWFVLTEMLGYKHVKFYDGSAQEWAADPDAPMVTE